VGGQAFLCSNSQELKNQLKQLFISKHWQYPFTFDSQIKNILSELNIKFFDSYDNFQKIDVGLNTCEFLAAWTGSVLVSSALPGGRQLNVFSPELIFICNKNQLVLDPGQALIKLKQKYNNNLPSQFSFITGPSKTADIEKTLIYGMHGAKKVYVFILL
jgi:L-lactate dehydrogenase complex protein LldG